MSFLECNRVRGRKYITTTRRSTAMFGFCITSLVSADYNDNDDDHITVAPYDCLQGCRVR